MSKKQATQETQVVEEYPRYISNHPKGADLFDGKSQERLAQAIAMHITDADKNEKPIFSRLLGLEGKWGSGKSNVIRILEDKFLKEKYTFFAFDAWGNQEDLQRRSILELLTKELITKGKLTGKTTMRVMKPEKDGKIEEESCTWPEKLNSLLSRKSYTRDITVPSVNNSTKWFVLALLAVGIVVAFLAVNNTGIWWLDILISLSPLILFSLGMLVTWSSWRKMFAMYNTGDRSDTTSYVISEQEPSVREFKEWMNEVSKSLPYNEKLVIVFDNMDRLTSEKVHQFWSLIQTFFADDGYKNIWCIVPYDESHLAAVFSDKEEDDTSIELLRRYLSKTFPVVYRVPEPIISDYKNIFETLYRDAFGTTVDDDNLELISQCYRHVNTVPNVREIISFINSQVKLVKQWGNTISPVSSAIYLLSEDTILRKPQIQSGADGKMKEVSTDEYILANGYYNAFSQLLFGKVDRSEMQQEIAALVYGITPADAAQIVVKRYIRNSISDKDKKTSLVPYLGNPQFMLLLQEDVQSMAVTDFANAATLVNEIDEASLSVSDKKRLANIWRHFAEHFIHLNAPVNEYTDFYKLVFIHVQPSLAERCVSSFYKRLIDNSKEVDGTKLYLQLSAVFNEHYADGFDIRKVCPDSVIDGKRFADYVLKAGADYKRFPITSKPEGLNRALEQAIDKTYPYFEVLRLLKDDTTFTVSEVGTYAVEQLNLKKSSALVASNLIAIQRIFYPLFQSSLDANYIQTLWQEAQTDESKAAYDEIFTLKSIGSMEQLPQDDKHVDILIDKVLFFTSTTQLIKDYLSNPNVHFRANLLEKMLKEKKHDSKPDYVEFIENWQTIVSNRSISRDVMVQFADSWGYKDVPEPAKTKKYFALLADTAWIDVLKASETPLANALLTKCVADMALQPVEQYITVNTSSHTNSPWSVALQKLIDTDYITPESFGLMAELATYLLNFAAKNTPFNDSTWNVLLSKVSFASISSQIIDIRNNILNGVQGYAMNPSKFQMLHMWLEQSGINGANHCDDAANQILAKVIDNEDCQRIILDNRNYYRPIISNTVETASALHEKLKTMLQNQGDSEFAGFVQEVVTYNGSSDEA